MCTLNKTGKENTYGQTKKEHEKERQDHVCNFVY